MESAGSFLAVFDGWARMLLQELLDLPWPVTLAIICAPIAAAIGSRKLVAAAGALLSALLAATALAPGTAASTTLATLTLYGAAWLFALLGFRQTAQERTALELNRGIERIHRELGAFLDALDRRASTVEELMQRSTRPRPEAVDASREPEVPAPTP